MSGLKTSKRMRALLLSLTFCMWGAQAQVFEAGEHYEVLPIPVKPVVEGKVEVVEVFSYGCIHCFSFDPLIEGWLGAIPDDVRFERLPAIFSQDWALLAQLYYTAEVLDVLGKVHTPIFNGIHVDRLDLRDPNVAAELFEREAGISKDQFLEVSNSFSVRSRSQQAMGRTRAYRITGVPTMVVAGKYRVDGRMAGSNGKMLEIVDFLVEKERNAQLGDQLDNKTDEVAADEQAAEQ